MTSNGHSGLNGYGSVSTQTLGPVAASEGTLADRRRARRMRQGFLPSSASPTLDLTSTPDRRRDTNNQFDTNTGETSLLEGTNIRDFTPVVSSRSSGGYTVPRSSPEVSATLPQTNGHRTPDSLRSSRPHSPEHSHGARSSNSRGSPYRTDQEGDQVYRAPGEPLSLGDGDVGVSLVRRVSHPLTSSTEEDHTVRNTDTSSTGGNSRGRRDERTNGRGQTVTLNGRDRVNLRPGRDRDSSGIRRGRQYRSRSRQPRT